MVGYYCAKLDDMVDKGILILIQHISIYIFSHI